MQPIYDKGGKAAGWLKDGDIYSAAGVPAAFLHGDCVVNYAGLHCGVLRNNFFRDLDGKVAAFLRGAEGGPRLPFVPPAPLPPHPGVHPMRPPVPMAPPQPMPVLAWSDLSWEQFVSGLRAAAFHPPPPPPRPPVSR